MKKVLLAILTALLVFGGIPGIAGAQTIPIAAGSGVGYASGGATVTVAGGPSAPTSGGSGATISQQQALAIAEGIFPDLAKENVDANLDDYQAPGNWNLTWREPSSVAGPAFRENSIDLNAVTGALNNFDISDWEADKTGSPLITRDEALQKAEAFIKQYHPEELAQSVLSPNTLQPNYGQFKTVTFTYNFNWERREQGVPVANDGIMVGVDPFSGRIVNCSFTWHTGITFPAAVAVDAAKETELLNQFGVIPCYQVQPGQLNAEGVPEASLVYMLNCAPGLQIDPNTGSALTSDGKTTSLQDYVLLPGLTPAVSSTVYAGTPTVAPAQQVSPDVARQNAQRFFQALGLSGQAVAGGGGGSSWDGTFYEKTLGYTLESDTASGVQPGQQPPTVQVNAATGEVQNYSNFQGIQTTAVAPGSATTPSLTPDEARTKALAFIKQVSPDKADQLVAANAPQMAFYAGNNQSVSVSFIRLIDGIPFPQDGIEMVFDQAGQVISYNCNWHQVALAPSGKIITADQARQILLQQDPFKAEYTFPVSLAANYRIMQGNGQTPANPFFALNFQGVAIAADTGKPVPPGVSNFLGIGIGNAEQQPAAVVPHDNWAAAPLTILADSGMLPSTGFQSDNPVTRRDALRVLMGSLGMTVMEQPGQAPQSVFSDVYLNDPDYDLIQAAMDNGMLDPGPSLNPDGTITRADFTEWLVRAMGYRQVAEMPASITLSFTDVKRLSNTERNCIAIAEGLGIVKGGTNAMFYPDAPLTWAELASMVTEAAPRLQMF